MILFVLYAIFCIEIYIIWEKSSTMMYLKRSIKNKLFHDKRCRKCLIRKSRRRKTKKAYHKTNGIIKIDAPTVLNLFNETEKTLSFFSDVVNKISQCGYEGCLYFNLSAVEFISPDAIMYLIAIISNNKRIRSFRIQCKGNVPKNNTARQMFYDTGFFDFVNSKGKAPERKSEYMAIRAGRISEPAIATEFCDFVNCRTGKNAIATKKLFPMLIELMTNTVQHAYGSNLFGEAKMLSNWYVFAQDVGDSIRFIFLDTGLGIPRTVSKRLFEIVKDVFTSKTDAAYLKSALTGEGLRSETGLTYRGNGLPEIYKTCCAGKISGLSIISGRAICSVSGNTAETRTITSPLEGTLFSWNVTKGEIQA